MSFEVGIIRNSINATLSRRKRVMDFSNSPSRDLFMWSLWLESSFETKKRSGLPQPAKVCEIANVFGTWADVTHVTLDHSIIAVRSSYQLFVQFFPDLWCMNPLP
jgi:hypothetical protein